MQPEPPPYEDAAPVRRVRGGWRLGLTLLGLIVGAAGLAASAAGVSAQLLPRKFTPAQQQRIMAWETEGRWRTMSAGKIFPTSVTYRLPGTSFAASNELPLIARRVGIAKQATCAAASDPAAAKVLSADRCAAMLRATYADETDSMLVTVGVAVMPSNAVAKSAASQLSSGRQRHPGVRVAPFHSTLAGRFTNRQRQLSWSASEGPYLILSTAGYSDGRPHVQESSDAYADQEMTKFANGVADAIGTPLGALPPSPHCPGGPGC
jgi:hypothetical protein